MSSPRQRTKRRKPLLSIREIAIFAMLGALMMVSDLVMNIIPNVHLGGMFIAVYTLVYRAKALLPIYVYVFLIGLFEGFGLWWVSYLYVWAILWLFFMLLPKKMPKWLAPVVYCTVCALHGFAFGTLYAPAQALLFGLDFEETLLWIASGLPFDLIHGISNLVCGCLVLPFSELLMRLMRKSRG